jgi:hypothetical protein
MEPTYFPENFNCEENYNYSGTYPDLEQYFLCTDSKLEKVKKRNFYKTNKLHLNYFNFKDNLIAYLKSQCYFFPMACLTFLKESID